GVCNRFLLASGMIQSAGALVMQDPKVQVDTSSTDILEIPGTKSEPAKTETLKTQTRKSEQSESKTSTRHDIKSPEGEKMLAKYTQAITLMRQLPESNPHS